MPDTYYRELFYPFSPIFQMFYYLETGELLKLVIEAHLFQGARLQAIGSISGTSNLWHATRQCLRRAVISSGHKKSQQRAKYPILKTPSFICKKKKKMPLRQALSCHFTCKCYARNCSNFHNSRSSWQWQWKWPRLAVIRGLVLIVYMQQKSHSDQLEVLSS